MSQDSDHPEEGTTTEIRERVLGALALIRSSDVIVSVNPTLPPERIAYELCRMWMDSVWLPGRRYLDGLKGDWKPEDELAFEDAFSVEEYGWIERFHRFLELRIDRLSDKDREEGRFPATDTWRGIVRDAGNLVDLIERDDEARAQRLADVRSRLEGGRIPFSARPKDA